MADVQLEDGYLRLANRLICALALAPWSSGGQIRMAMALLRLTWGVNRKCARISPAEWVRQTGLSEPSVERLRKELRTAGVFIEVERADPAKNLPAVWQFQKDFERWGRYAVPEAKVVAAEAQAGEFLQRIEIVAPPQPQGEGADPGGAPPADLPGGQSPAPGGGRARKSPQARKLRAAKDTSGKTGKRQKRAPRALTPEEEQLNRDAVSLTALVVEKGMHGQAWKGGLYTRQIGRAKQILADAPLSYWQEAVTAMRGCWPYNIPRKTFDVFNLAVSGPKALAEVGGGTTGGDTPEYDPYDPKNMTFR